MSIEKDYLSLCEWMESALDESKLDDVVAFNFNLYEGAENAYHVQIIGSESFDEEDEDWACDEVYTSGENLLMIERTDEIQDWMDGLEYITKIVERYLNEGGKAHILKSVTAVGIGFTDGEISVLYKKKLKS